MVRNVANVKIVIAAVTTKAVTVLVHEACL